VLSGVGRGLDLRVAYLPRTSSGVSWGLHPGIPKARILRDVSDLVYSLLLGGVSVTKKGRYRVFGVVGGPTAP